MVSEIKVFPRENGEHQRVHIARLPNWEQLELLRPTPSEDALECFYQIYRLYLVPSAPQIFGSLVLFSLIPFVFDRIRVPIFSRVDRAIGLILGIFTGVFVASLISSAIYSSLELVSSFGIAEDAMRAYGDSTVFKFMHRLDISRLV